jgi:hypothetical protein
MATEKTLQQYIVRILKHVGCITYKFASPSNRGVPDLIVITPTGNTLYIEVKHPNKKGKLTELQKHTINKFRNQKATVYVVDSKEEARRIANRIEHHG